MTTIYHREYYDRLFLTIEGHSNFGNYGEDIVCAGISTLAYTLLNCMLDEESAGNIKLIRNIVRDGFLHLEIEYSLLPTSTDTIPSGNVYKRIFSFGSQ